MKNTAYITFLLLTIIALQTGCKRPYNPPAVKEDNHFLVIDGTLLSSIDSPSIINLGRTVKLADTVLSSPENGAAVSVESSGGETFSFVEIAAGRYRANPLTLNPASKYRLKISTTSGGEYASDFVEMKLTPEIDSLTWRQENDVRIFANTHDNNNNTKYYRWDFEETWQYRAQLQSELGVTNGIMFYTDALHQRYNCWSSAGSTEILVGTSVALSQDVISQAPIAFIPQNDEKIGIRYSMLLKQYAIPEKAYQYFSILKKNTENLGSIFDAQPAQLNGNIHSINNPEEVVVGYFTASSVTQKRIFIDHAQLNDWTPKPFGNECNQQLIGQNPTNYLIYDYPDTDYLPYFFSGQTGLVIAKKPCLDCTLHGGVPDKPSFW